MGFVRFSRIFRAVRSSDNKSSGWPVCICICMQVCNEFRDDLRPPRRPVELICICLFSQTLSRDEPLLSPLSLTIFFFPLFFFFSFPFLSFLSFFLSFFSSPFSFFLVADLRRDLGFRVSMHSPVRCVYHSVEFIAGTRRR